MGRAGPRRRRAGERRAGDRGFGVEQAEAAVVLLRARDLHAGAGPGADGGVRADPVRGRGQGGRQGARPPGPAGVGRGDGEEGRRRVAQKVAVSREGDLVRVAVEAAAPGPGVLNIHLRADAVALAEETVGLAEEPVGSAEADEAAGTAEAVDES